MIFTDHCKGNWVLKSLLLICKILRVFVNILNADDNYFLLNRVILM